MPEIRTLHLPLPAGWQAGDDAAVPPLPWMKHAGISVETHAAADAHLDAVAEALEQAEWRWRDVSRRARPR